MSPLTPTADTHHQRLVTSAAAQTLPTTARATEAPQVAVIAGRHCLAYQGSFCSTCRERCPIAGAIVVERGLPRVNPELCDGCRVCHELCPAPTNAILMVGRAGSPNPPRVATSDRAALGERALPSNSHA